MNSAEADEGGVSPDLQRATAPRRKLGLREMMARGVVTFILLSSACPCFYPSKRVTFEDTQTMSYSALIYL